LAAAVSSDRTTVRVWVNAEREPDLVVIALE
jgi:hypothetical protein